METNEPVDNSTVDNDPGCIDEQIAGLVDAAVDALESAGADEASIETFEAIGKDVVESLEPGEDGAESDQEGVDEHDGRDGTDSTEDRLRNCPSDESDRESLREQVEANSEKLEDLAEDYKEYRHRVAKERATTCRRVTEAEDRLSTIEDRCFDGEPPRQTSEDHSVARVEPKTHLEDVARLPSRLTEDESPNVRRALFVARDVVEYTRSIPAGRAIKWSELRRVLRAGTDCDAHPQTVKRVMETLDDFGEDTVKIVDKDDREKLICFDEEAAARLHHLCGEDQSADSTHGVVSRSEG